VDDLIGGIVALILSNAHDPVNLGNPNEITILQLAQLINKKLKNEGQISYLEGRVAGVDPVRRKPDISRAQQVLGWNAKISLDDGLDRTIPYFRDRLKSEQSLK
jgi:dTDP-glucose 4,6-dehydratase